MIDKGLLAVLVCPDNRTPLEAADSNLLARLNQSVLAGRVRNRAGEPVKNPLAGGLIRRDGRLLYPIIDGIPVLLVEEAIPLEQIR